MKMFTLDIQLGYSTANNTNTNTNTTSHTNTNTHTNTYTNTNTNTNTRLINKLIECRKYYDLILFPCERHAPHKLQDRIYMEDRIYSFFIDSLQKNNSNSNSNSNSNVFNVDTTTTRAHL